MNATDAIAYLSEILYRVRLRRGATFTGLGLLLYQEALGLPIAPLRKSQPMDLPLEHLDDIVDALLGYADLSSPYHDGFHLVSMEGHLTHLSQYFAPPIVPGLPLQMDDFRYGGRYRAAQYGSCIPAVAACGVLTAHYGPVLLVNGVAELPESDAQACA